MTADPIVTELRRWLLWLACHVDRLDAGSQLLLMDAVEDAAERIDEPRRPQARNFETRSESGELCRTVTPGAPRGVPPTPKRGGAVTADPHDRARIAATRRPTPATRSATPAD